MLKSLVYDSLDYEIILQEVCKVSKGRISGQFCFPDASMVEGIAWYEKTGKEIQVSYCNLLVKHDFIIFRRAIPEQWYVLHFDQLSINGPMEIKLHLDIVSEDPGQISLSYLKSTMFDWHYIAPAGTRITMVDILLPAHVVADYLEVQDPAEILTRYIELSATKLLSEKMDPVAEEYVRDIMEKKTDDPLWKMTIHNRVNLLIEHFFLRLDEKLINWQADKKIRTDDVERVRESEKWLVGDLSEPAPTIEYLASQSAMSASKYKSLFKTIYGTSVHEYYQRRRMMRAAELLATGKYQVKDVGYELGYSNLGSFTRAFRKEFNLTPSQLLSDQDG